MGSTFSKPPVALLYGPRSHIPRSPSIYELWECPAYHDWTGRAHRFPATSRHLPLTLWHGEGSFRSQTIQGWQPSRYIGGGGRCWQRDLLLFRRVMRWQDLRRPI